MVVQQNWRVKRVNKGKVLVTGASGYIDRKSVV
jgi:hypothetical protein